MLRRILAVVTLLTLLSIAWQIPGHAGDQGTVAIANRADGTISLIDVATDQVIDTILLPGVSPQPMYVNYAQEKVFVGDRANNLVVVYDAEDFSLLATVPAGRGEALRLGYLRGEGIIEVRDVVLVPVSGAWR